MPDPLLKPAPPSFGGDDDDQSAHDPRNPGALVGFWGTTALAFILIAFTVGLLYYIATRWPACELQDDRATANAAANANQNANASTNANTNASGAAANTNSRTNANSSGTNAINPGGNQSNTNAANKPAAPPTAANSPTTQKAAATALDADSLEPSSGPITGNTLVTIKGKNFGSRTEGLSVRFGERPALIREVSDKILSVRTPVHSEGLVDVTVARGEESDTLTSAFTYTCPAPSGSVLFMMVIMAGALGGSIHALRSLYWYAGQGSLIWRWVPMYFVLPFIGAAMAMIFSLLIFAGFVDNNTGRSQALFIIAVAGLVGMFSQQAALKLTDVANAFFTKPGGGRDAQPQQSLSVSQKEEKGAPITVTAIAPTQGAAKGGDEVKITGSGFNTSTKVSFGGTPANIKSLNDTTITVTAPAHSAGDVDIEVKLGDQVVKSPVKFTYTP